MTCEKQEIYVCILIYTGYEETEPNKRNPNRR